VLAHGNQQCEDPDPDESHRHQLYANVLTCVSVASCIRIALMILSSPNPKLIRARAVRIQARVVRSAAARLRVLANSVLVLDICADIISLYCKTRNHFKFRALINDPVCAEFLHVAVDGLFIFLFRYHNCLRPYVNDGGIALALEFQLGAVALVRTFLNYFLSLELKEKEQTS
jgi:hypothetical protein